MSSSHVRVKHPCGMSPWLSGREEAGVVALGDYHVGDGDVAVSDVATVQLADRLHNLRDLQALHLHSHIACMFSQVLAAASRLFAALHGTCACSLLCAKQIAGMDFCLYKCHGHGMKLYLEVLAL